jgi:hypothetical protein
VREQEGKSDRNGKGEKVIHRGRQKENEKKNTERETYDNHCRGHSSLAFRLFTCIARFHAITGVFVNWRLFSICTQNGIKMRSLNTHTHTHTHTHLFLVQAHVLSLDIFFLSSSSFLLLLPST